MEICRGCARAVCLECAIPVRGRVLCAACATGELGMSEDAAGAGYAVPVERGRIGHDAVILLGAMLFLLAAFVAGWYRAGGDEAFGIPIPTYSFNAWGGATFVAGVAAAVAVAWVLLRRLRVLRETTGLVDLALAGTGVLFTLLGLAIDRSTPAGSAGSSWGFALGIPLGLLWLGGSLLRYRSLRGGERQPADHGFARP